MQLLQHGQPERDASCFAFAEIFVLFAYQRLNVDPRRPFPGGARPSYAHGYYARDNAAYLAWDAVAADRGRFIAWLGETISTEAAARLEALT